MPIKSGDFVLIDYVLKVKDTGEIFDVTIEDQARASNAYSPEQVYEPKLIAVGEGWIIKGIEEALVGLEEGQEKGLEIPAEKSFGERDGTKVKIIPAREMTRQGLTPRPGARVEVGGQLATIRSVGSGRVTIDFNHPLAGKTMEAKVYIRKIIIESTEKIRELVHRRIRNVSKDKFTISELGNLITIGMPEEAFTLEDIQFAKKGLAKEISRYFPDTTTVQFIESYIVKHAPKEVATAPEATANEPTKEVEEIKTPAEVNVAPEDNLSAEKANDKTEEKAEKKGGKSRKKAQPQEQ